MWVESYKFGEPVFGLHESERDALGFDPEDPSLERVFYPEMTEDFQLRRIVQVVEEGKEVTPEESLYYEWQGELFRQGNRLVGRQFLETGHVITVVFDDPIYVIKEDEPIQVGEYHVVRGTKTKYSQFHLEKIVVSHPEGGAWDICEIPNVSQFIFRIGTKTEKENSPMFSKKGDIALIYHLNSWDDIRVLLHEVGHSITFASENREESHKKGIAGKIIDIVFSNVEYLEDRGLLEELEDDWEMTLIHAIQLEQGSEISANLALADLISQVREPLRIEESLLQRITEAIEKQLQGYDYTPFPDTGASYLSRFIPRELREAYLECYELIGEMQKIAEMIKSKYFYYPSPDYYAEFTYEDKKVYISKKRSGFRITFQRNTEGAIQSTYWVSPWVIEKIWIEEGEETSGIAIDFQDTEFLVNQMDEVRMEFLKALLPEMHIILDLMQKEEEETIPEEDPWELLGEEEE